LEYNWKPKHQYEFIVDSAAISSIYGYSTQKYSRTFRTKSPEDYSDFKVMIAAFDERLVLQLLDSRENVVVAQQANEKGNSFKFLKPGDYFMRAFIDSNRNGQWDSGDLLQRIQPEEMIYYSKKISLKANWEQEESWDPLAADARLKRPEELKKVTKK
jgi:murein L,D-transpeptidase YcbB/YkuD